MRIDVLLDLRHERAPVSLIQRPGHPRPELGTALPLEDTRREAIPGRWSQARPTPRAEPPATIDEPLPVRSQTILSYRVPVDVRRAINGEVTDALPASRRHAIAIEFGM